MDTTELSHRSGSAVANLSALSVFSIIALSIGLIALVLATNPVVVLLGKLIVAVSLGGFAAVLTTHVMRLGASAMAMRNEDFHWH